MVVVVVVVDVVGLKNRKTGEWYSCGSALNQGHPVRSSDCPFLGFCFNLIIKYGNLLLEANILVPLEPNTRRFL